MIQIIATLLLIALLVYGIVKQYNTVTLLFVLGLAALGVYTLVTGEAIVESTSGSRFIDLFEQINVIAKNQLQGTILVVMSVLAYVNYMSTLKASELFALIVAEPLKKLKSPYLLAGLTIVFGACLKLVIPSAISMQSLLLATLYPVLLAVGVSKATAATALLLAGTIVWGPAESLTYMAFSVAGIDDVPVAQFFVSHEILSVLLMFVFMVPVFMLTSKKFDKKKHRKYRRDSNL